MTTTNRTSSDFAREITDALEKLEGPKNREEAAACLAALVVLAADGLRLSCGVKDSAISKEMALAANNAMYLVIDAWKQRNPRSDP